MRKYRVKSVIVATLPIKCSSTDTTTEVREYSDPLNATMRYQGELKKALDNDSRLVAFDIRLEEMRADGTYRVLHRSTF